MGLISDISQTSFDGAMQVEAKNLVSLKMNGMWWDGNNHM